MENLQQAHLELIAAYSNFDFAEGRFAIDLASHKITVAEANYDFALALARQ